MKGIGILKLLGILLTLALAARGFYIIKYESANSVSRVPTSPSPILTPSPILPPVKEGSTPIPGNNPTIEIPPVKPTVNPTNPTQGIKITVQPDPPHSDYDGWNLRRDPCVSSSCLFPEETIVRTSDDVQLLEWIPVRDSSGVSWSKVKVKYPDKEIVGYLATNAIIVP
jgi:hypothetical protein